VYAPQSSDPSWLTASAAPGGGVTLSFTANTGTAPRSANVTVLGQTIVVTQVVIAPASLTYSVNPATYTNGTAIPNNTPSSSGGLVTSYSVSPALPAGLSLDASSGVISGTPNSVSAAANYTVTASNSGGSTTATLSIAVLDTSAPVLSNVPANITVDAPANSATAVVNWTAPSASDNVGVTSFSSDHSPGEAFPVGVTMVTYTAQDAAGNTATASFTVTVVDLTKPDVDGIGNLLKYALVLPVGTPAAGLLPQPQIRTYPEGQRLSLDFTRDPSRNDITIAIVASDSPAGPWTTIASSINGAPFDGEGLVQEVDAGDGLKAVEVRDTVNIGAQAHRFMRIEVTR
jgi:hypothetical protein